ncbi:12861_t:CDS:2, partial [Gigaspora rosea]
MCMIFFQFNYSNCQNIFEIILEKKLKSEWIEIISGPVTFGDQKEQVVQHADLPVVKDELSITLRIKLNNHASTWATIFHKGTEYLICTPGLWLTAYKSALHAQFTGNWCPDSGFTTLDKLLLQKWYHECVQNSEELNPDALKKSSKAEEILEEIFKESSHYNLDKKKYPRSNNPK